MNIEEAIKNCEISLNQIEHYDPDPFYVNYFFNEFITSVNNSINGIFEEANRDFGLFISENISEKSFFEKAEEKQDLKAKKFSEWFSAKYKQEHKNPYPNIIKKILEFKNKFGKIPEIKIMIRAKDRYKDDIYQQIKVGLTNQKIRSKEELEIEIKRQIPTFLEIINLKRKERNEPKVGEKQVMASAFLDISNHKDVEIVYAAEIYVPVVKRLVEESRNKIRELTTWN